MSQTENRQTLFRNRLLLSLHLELNIMHTGDHTTHKLMSSMRSYEIDGLQHTSWASLKSKLVDGILRLLWCSSSVIQATCNYLPKCGLYGFGIGPYAVPIPSLWHKLLRSSTSTWSTSHSFKIASRLVTQNRLAYLLENKFTLKSELCYDMKSQITPNICLAVGRTHLWGNKFTLKWLKNVETLI